MADRRLAMVEPSEQVYEPPNDAESPVTNPAAFLRSKTAHAREKSGRKSLRKVFRTPAQLARQERVFDLSVVRGRTIRAIAVELGISSATIEADLRCESERRMSENEAQREAEKAKSLAFYAAIIDRALETHELYNQTLRERGATGSDQFLQVCVKSRERMDKINGIDSAVKIEVGIATLAEALTELPD